MFYYAINVSTLDIAAQRRESDKKQLRVGAEQLTAVEVTNI